MNVKVKTDGDTGSAVITPSGKAEFCNFIVEASKDDVCVNLAYVDSTEGVYELAEALNIALDIHQRLKMVNK